MNLTGSLKKLISKTVLGFTISAFVFSLSTQIFAAKGNLDRRFSGGKVVTSVAGAEKAYDAAVQSDGKIVVVGGKTPAQGGNWDFLVQRYNADGTLDENFGSEGKVLLGDTDKNEVAYAVTLQSDGKIVVTGYVSTLSSYADIAVARLLQDGQIDQSFGTNGKQIFSATDTSDIPSDVEMQTINGIEKIVVGSYVSTANTKFSVARLNLDGQMDTTFGTNGMMSVTIYNTNDVLEGIAIDSSNRIVAAGWSRIDLGPNGYRDEFAVVRFTANGQLDTSFSGDGKHTLQMAGSAQARSVVVQNVYGEEKIVIGGFSRNGMNNDFALARFNADGTLDTSFGTNGKTYTDFLTQEEQIHKLLIQSDEKVVGVGFMRWGSNQNFAAARYNLNGKLDTTYGSLGKVTTDFGSNTDIAYGATIQPNNKVIAVGESVGAATSADFAVTRYTTGAQSTQTNTDFDGDGKEDIAVFRPSQGAWYINNNGDGFKAVIFGTEGDIPVAADYDGDGRTDIAVFRSGFWYILRSSDGEFTARQFGQAGDVPVVGDYDGDEKADIAVWRAAAGGWYILRSSDGEFTGTAYGLEGDTPVPADYDGDGLTDLAVYHAGQWWIRKSTTANGGSHVYNFGLPTDIALAGDYDGDGKADLNVFRQGVWYHQLSNVMRVVNWGMAADKPVAMDYDDDGKMDAAVFRDGIWYILKSSNNQMAAVQFGLGDDIPVAAR